MQKYTKDYEEFWQAYPRKVGKLAAFKKYKMALGYIAHDELIEKVKAYAQSVNDKEKQFIPHPATWLNGGRWDDELEEAPFNASEYLKQKRERENADT